MYSSLATAFASITSVAALLFSNTITPALLKTQYRDAGSFGGPVKILIVPGHEPTSGGTAFRGMYERDAVVPLAQKIAEYLFLDPRLSVTVSRTTESWEPQLGSYISNNKNQIIAWRADHGEKLTSAISSGSFTTSTGVGHANATPSAVVALYGINKWTDENDYQIVISVHLNDYAGRRYNKVGIYRGHSIYVPEHQLSNSQAAKEIGTKISEALRVVQPISNLKGESKGVIEDQELIATGAYNTADTANLLIEYGYIYEPQFQTSSLREEAFDTYARLTAEAIRNYLASR